MYSAENSRKNDEVKDTRSLATTTISTFTIQSITINIEHIVDPTQLLLHNSKSKSKSEIFAYLWASGFVAAEIIAKLPTHSISEKHILEVGCGSGVTSQTAALCEAFVTMSDTSQEALDICLRSSELNHVKNYTTAWRTGITQ